MKPFEPGQTNTEDIEVQLVTSMGLKKSSTFLPPRISSVKPMNLQLVLTPTQ